MEQVSTIHRRIQDFPLEGMVVGGGWGLRVPTSDTSAFRQKYTCQKRKNWVRLLGSVGSANELVKKIFTISYLGTMCVVQMVEFSKNQGFNIGLLLSNKHDEIS